MRRRLSIATWASVTVGLCVLIFWMSSREGSTSSGMSARLAATVADLAVPSFSSMPAARQESIVETLQLPIRKGGHLAEYAALGVAVSRLLMLLRKDRGKHTRRIATHALVLCVAYATGDEIHQLFVAGRNGNPLDVLVDAVGATAGITLVMMLAGRSQARRPHPDA